MASTDYSAKDGKRQSRAAGLWKRNKRVGEPVVYRDVDKERLLAALDLATQAGAAIMFGITSDGGAFSVCILHNNDKIKEYFHSAADMNNFLAEICEEFV